MIDIENIILNLSVENQNINVPSTKIVSDSVNIVEVDFSFDSYWDGYVKTAVFKNGNKSVEVLLDTNTVTVPSEVLTAGLLKISVVGIQTEPYKRITTKEMYGINVEKCGSLTGDNSTEPTPEVLEQLTSKIDSANTAAKSALNLSNDDQNAASQAAKNAALSADRAEQAAVKNGYLYFDVVNGHLIETRTDNVNDDLTFSIKNGRLELTYNE